MRLQQRPSPCAGPNPPANLRGRLRAGCARAALLAVPAALSLGVLLPHPAAAAGGAIDLSGANTINDTYVFPGGTITSGAPQPLFYGAAGTPWTISNRGTIVGDNFGAAPAAKTDDWAIDLAGAGVSVVNNGVVKGYVGVYLGGGTVTNAGTIQGGSGTNAFGVEIANGGTVINRGAIETSAGTFGAAVDLLNGGTVSNYDAINGSSYGIRLDEGGVVTNAAGADISGQSFGILAIGASSQVTNAGTITGSGADAVGIQLLEGGTVSNLGTASQISGTGGGVQFGVSSGSGFLYNQGTITSTNGFGVYIGSGGGTVTNSGTASKISSSYGVLAVGNGTLTNQGTITETSSRRPGGVVFEAGGTVTNSGAASYILGATNGVYVSGATGSVTNDGTIIGNNGAGVDLDDGGTVTNAATGTISGVTGIEFGGATPSMLINAGTVIGDTFAVQFGSGNDLLVIDPGAEFFGIADGGGGANTLELAAGTLGNTGTIAGIGSGFTNFQNVAIAAGASWQLQQTNTIATLANAGTLTNTGALTTGMFTDSGQLTNSGSITGTVTLTNTGVVTNQIGGSIAGGAAGIFGVAVGTGSGPSVSNAGIISASSGTGVALTAGASVSNSGLISGTFAGVGFGSGVSTLTNTGTIEGTGAAGIGVLFAGSAQGTIDNLGTNFGLTTGVGLGGGILHVAGAAARSMGLLDSMSFFTSAMARALVGRFLIDKGILEFLLPHRVFCKL